MSDYKQTRDAAGKVTSQYNKMLRNLDDNLVQQDDDFHPASAGDDPIWLGGVEYITRQRSDDLVQAERSRCARVAETEGVAPWTNTNQPESSWYKHGQRIAAAIREGGK